MKVERLKMLEGGYKAGVWTLAVYVDDIYFELPDVIMFFFDFCWWIKASFLVHIELARSLKKVFRARQSWRGT